MLAGTLHGIHAITSRLSPVGSSSGVQVIEGESFKMNILLTATGLYHDHQISAASDFSLSYRYQVRSIDLFGRDSSRYGATEDL